MIRPISDLPALVGAPDWVEVEQAGGFFKAPGSAFQSNAQDIYQLTALQVPFAASFADVGPLAMTPATSGTVAIVGGAAVFSGTGAAGGEVDYTTALAFGASAFDIGAPFTIEGWFKTASIVNFATLMERSVGGASPWGLIINNAPGDGKLAFYDPDGAPAALTTHAWNDNVRHHVRVVKYWNSTMIWVDGILDAHTITNPPAGWATSNNTVKFGNSANAGRFFIGSLDNWRIVKGIAVSTLPKFTVPAPPFPTS